MLSSHLFPSMYCKKCECNSLHTAYCACVMGGGAPTWQDYNFIHNNQLSIDWECSFFSLSIYLCLMSMHWECDCRSAQQCREWKEKLRRGRTPKDLTAPVVSARPCGEERTSTSFNFLGVFVAKIFLSSKLDLSPRELILSVIGWSWKFWSGEFLILIGHLLFLSVGCGFGQFCVSYMGW